MVSTVFLGMNHQFGDGPPLLWETMVFMEPPSLTESYCDRYPSKAAALKGHDKAVRWAMRQLKKKDIIGNPVKMLKEEK
jgi:hypothetical protein